jgi:hypothetical protein
MRQLGIAGNRIANRDRRRIAVGTTVRSDSPQMAFARELPIPSESAVAASVLVVEDDPANRVLLTRGPRVS